MPEACPPSLGGAKARIRRRGRPPMQPACSAGTDGGPEAAEEGTYASGRACLRNSSAKDRSTRGKGWAAAVEWTGPGFPV